MSEARNVLPLAGKRALVTGASTGIGRAIALALAEAGADVAVHDRTRGEGAEATAAGVRGAGRRSLTLEADLADPRHIAGMFERLCAEWGGADILVNNAGISPAKPLREFTADEVLAVIAVNLSGALLCAREVLRDMVTGGWGRIINISSVHSLANNPGRVPYAASKGGLNAMTRALAVEYGPLGICTNSLVVGAIATERTLEDPLAPQRLEQWKAAIPVGRWGTPEEIARLAVFLADPLSGFINGACLTIDGGNLSLVPHP